MIFLIIQLFEFLWRVSQFSSHFHNTSFISIGSELSELMCSWNVVSGIGFDFYSCLDIHNLYAYIASQTIWIDNLFC